MQRERERELKKERKIEGVDTNKNAKRERER